MDPVRLFVAVEPPPDAVGHLAEVVGGLAVSRAHAPGASARVTPPDRWHVTLAFLGDVPADRVDDAAAALDHACAAGGAPGLSICFAGGGTFGRGRFTIVWAGLSGDVAGLRSLAADLRVWLRRARLPFDRRGFRPHLTLARPGARLTAGDLTAQDIAADVAALQQYRGPLWPVAPVHLVRSEFLTTPEGVQPRYTSLHTSDPPG